MKRIIAYIFLFLFTSIAYCQTYSYNYYLPSTQNIPLFREKNEFRATIVGAGMAKHNRESAIADIQLAYSFSDRFAVLGNVMGAMGTEYHYTLSAGSIIRDYYAHSFEGAFGYFIPLEYNGVFEVYAGIGNRRHTHYDDVRVSADLFATKYFVQPTLGYTYNAFDIAATMSVGYISFNKINYSTEDSTYVSPIFYHTQRIAQNKNSLLFEPGVTVRGGWKYLKFQVQYVYSENLSHQLFVFADHKISCGLTYSFAKRYRNKAVSNPTE